MRKGQCSLCGTIGGSFNCCSSVDERSRNEPYRDHCETCRGAVIVEILSLRREVANMRKRLREALRAKAVDQP